MIVRFGEKGGFPNLKKINFYDMNRANVNEGINKARGDIFQQEINDCLEKLWPNITFTCHFNSFSDYKYGKPDEFYNPEFDASDNLESEDLDDSESDDVNNSL
jgi:hypothetical protein